jgi:hypothetical protein
LSLYSHIYVCLCGKIRGNNRSFMNKLISNRYGFWITISVTITLFVALVIYSYFSLNRTNAQTTVSYFSGYAWGGNNNVGWIDFSGVTLNQTTGALAGSAWSSTLGWLSFDRAVTGTPPTEEAGAGLVAKKSGSSIVGWGRFINACKYNLWDGTKCIGSGAGDANGVNPPDTDGQYWDGWVKMHNVTITTGGLVTGYAWGANNVGWIQFNLSNPCVGTNCGVIISNSAIVNATLNPSAIYTISALATPKTSTLSWSSYGVKANSCSIKKGTNVIATDQPSSGSRVLDQESSPTSILYTVVCIKEFTTSDTAQDSKTLTVLGDVTPPNPCSTPANAVLCSAEAGDYSGDQKILGEFGSCPSNPSEISRMIGTACYFECISPVFKVQGTACVRRSSIEEI